MTVFPPFAGFGQRLIAVLLDALILMPFTLMLHNTFGLFIESVMALIITGSYYTISMGSSWQATPGKRIMEVHVVRASDGGKLSHREALARYLAYLIPSLPIYTSLDTGITEMLVIWLSAAWFVPILITEQKTGVHDMLCHTRVVKGRLK